MFIIAKFLLVKNLYEVQKINKQINSECTIRTVSRTDNNPHGFMIEQYRVTNNAPINE